MAEGREKNPRFFDEDLEDHQPFPTLQTVLQELEQHVGCNIEIKWNMQLKVHKIQTEFLGILYLYLHMYISVLSFYNTKIVICVYRTAHLSLIIRLISICIWTLY